MRFNFAFILAVLMTFLLSACNEEMQTKKTSMPQTQQMNGKSHAPISMKYEISDELKLNDPIDIKLFFKAGLSTNALKVDIASSKGVVINSTQVQYQFNKVVKNEINAFVLNVTVTQLGKHVLNISTTIDVSGVPQARSFSVPLNIGSPATLKINNTSSAKGMKYIPEQNVISMPASETTN